MIVVDTNVISEPLRHAPSGRVLAWLDSQPRQSLYTAVTVMTELKMGIAILPAGVKRRTLDERIMTLLIDYFANRILSVSPETAAHHADAFAKARSQGSAISFADAQIAAIAKQHGYAVATRDEELFRAAGVDVINPWVA